MPYIVIEDISYTYPGKSEPAVKNVSLLIRKGEKVSITGLNGSGKSTLVKVILGFLKPQRGKVYLDKKPLKEYNLQEIGSKLGFVSQRPEQMIFNTCVYDEVAFGLNWRNFSRDKINKICKYYLEYFNLLEYSDQIPLSLSEGQKQLVVISAIMALNPQFIIFDEPTKSIDIARRKNLVELMKKVWRDGTGMIVVSHDKEFVKSLGTRNIRMHKGEVI